MKKKPLKRSSEYTSRVKSYAQGLAERYRLEISDLFLSRVEAAEALLTGNNMAGTVVPYLLADQHVVLRELYFDSGPVMYCLIYEITDDYLGLVSLWHGVGSRKTGTLIRLWEEKGKNLFPTT